MHRRVNITILLSVLLVIMVFFSGRCYGGHVSANYTIQNEVISGGGGSGTSTTYTNESTASQSTPLEPSGMGLSSPHYAEYPGFWHAVLGLPSPDTDGDGIPDSVDNCSLTPNPGCWQQSK
jgi:hypothetical protein